MVLSETIKECGDCGGAAVRYGAAHPAGLDDEAAAPCRASARPTRSAAKRSSSRSWWTTVGIAMGAGGTDVALETEDVALRSANSPSRRSPSASAGSPVASSARTCCSLWGSSRSSSRVRSWVWRASASPSCSIKEARGWWWPTPCVCWAIAPACRIQDGENELKSAPSSRRR